MRYIIMILIALISAVITGGVSPQARIFGAEPDVLLAVMLAMELREKTVTPVIVFSVAAIFMDAFYAPAIGYYSFPYAAAGLLVYAVFAKKRINKFYGPAAICAAAWLFKDCLSAAVSFLMGNSFDFFHIFLTGTLPGMPVNAVIIFPVYLIMNALYKNGFMAPRSAGIKDEFPGLVRKKR